MTNVVTLTRLSKVAPFRPGQLNIRPPLRHSKATRRSSWPAPTLRTPLPISPIGPTELRFTLDPDALRTAGRFDCVVVNPAPIGPLYTTGMWGNGTSNVPHLIVNYKY